jgi:hypothetical protein
MNWIKLITIIVVFSHLGCENKPKTEVKGTHQYKTENKVLKAYSAVELTQIWDSLCIRGGCLTGGQGVSGGKFGGEGCAFSIDKRWKDFLYETDKKQLAEFLIAQIPNKKTTKIHVCPFNTATKGELAIYCLQGISLVNFQELSPELEALQKTHIYEQTWILEIQNSKKQRENLQKLWRERLEITNR